MLVGFLQFSNRHGILFRIKSDIPGEIGIELQLIGIISLVERGLCSSYVWLRFVGFTAAGGNAGLSIFPAEQP